MFAVCLPYDKLLFLLESIVDFDVIRQNFCTASSLKDRFDNFLPKRIISFVHVLTNKT